MRLAFFLCLATACAVMFAGPTDQISEQGYAMSSLSEAEHLALILRHDLRRVVKVRMQSEALDSPNVLLVVSAPQRVHDGIKPFVDMLNELQTALALEEKEQLRKAIKEDRKLRKKQ